MNASQSHASVTSSSTTSDGKALLRFQIGPVQDFIAAARSTRDLWSGSYLLSWLVAHGLRAAIDNKASIVFPDIKCQPLLKFLKDGNANGSSDALKIPNLPNVFLLEVPAGTAAMSVATAVKQSIRNEWKNIAEAVWKFCEDRGLTRDEDAFTGQDRRDRFYRQVEKFLSIAWQITPWQTSDLYARNQRELDAVRQTRAFAAAEFSGWNTNIGTASNKDSLTGQLEAVAGGTEWGKRALERDDVQKRFKHSDFLSAPTLIKRLWDLAYLEERVIVKENDKDFPVFPFKVANTHGIADHRPFENTAEDDDGDDDSAKYFAVLKFDGDSVGQWISGEKTGDIKHKFHTEFSTTLSTFALDK